MSDSSNPDQIIHNYVNETTTSFDEALTKETGVHFLTEQINQALEPNKFEGDNDEGKDAPKGRTNLPEYMLRNDGTVICKMCGEVLQSRTHWYRHKYKRHVSQPQNSVPLFQCEQCLVYFKSRKGYIGHIASRHSELLSDSTPVLTNMKAEAFSKDNLPSTQVTQDVKEEPDPELVIPKTSVPNYQSTVVKHVTKATETKKTFRSKEPIVNQADWQERRFREDKLVADIFARVRRECEAHPNPAGPARRASSRRTTAIHSLRQTDALL